jgi:uracil-DNA glycosylase family 4
MTLALDPRQRAMLDEMGVKVWWPNDAVMQTEADAPQVIEPTARSSGVEAVATRERAAPLPPASLAPVPSGARPTSFPAAAVVPAKTVPAASAAAPQSPSVLIEAPQRLYDGTGTVQGGWLIVADMAPEPDGRHGAPFAGDAGRLLDNMLRALHLHRGDQPVHLMRTHRGSPTNASAPFAESFAAQASALAPRVVIAMGPLAAQALFESTEPLGKLRGRVVTPASLPGASVIATYPPTYLLRNPADKARAWADLCLAATKMDEATAQ